MTGIEGMGQYLGADELDEWLTVHYDPPWFQKNKGLQINR